MIPSKNCKHDMKMHLIFVVKYRKSLLRGAIKNDIIEFLVDSSKQSTKFSILEINSDLDHVHMLIEMAPTETVSNIVKRLKSYSTFHIWKKHEDQLQYQFWKDKMFWSKSYYVSSVGKIDEQVVTQYIKSQSQKEPFNARLKKLAIHPSS